MRNSTIGYIAAVALLLTTSVFSLNLFFQEKSSRDRIDIHSFPYIVGDWKGRDLEIKEFEYKILETRNLISREYVDSFKNKLYLFIIYSETNRSVFHPPEVCMIGSGVTIVDKQPERVDADKYSFLTNKLYAEKKGYKELVLYSYKAGNLYTENFYLQQAYLAFHQIFGKQIPGATIRVSISTGRDEKSALATLKSFLAETAKIVDNIT